VGEIPTGATKIQMNIPSKYNIHHCKIHRKYIHYFAIDNHLTGHHCWDCLRDRNNEKSVKERKLLEVQSQFRIDFAHLWNNNTLGGIISIKINDKELSVQIESSAEVLAQVPDTYLGYPVQKNIVGSI
jgi:hypothetical protein